VGLGRLGTPLAACLAERGFETLGIDIDPQVVRSINEGRALRPEPGLEAILKRHGGRSLRATTEVGAAIKETDVTIVLVATPSLDDGAFANDQVTAALGGLGKALRDSTKPHHLFVIASTVMPGTTRKTLIPLLELTSGRTLNRGFGVCVDPEFVALGKTVQGFLAPDLVVIGEGSSADGARLQEIHLKLCTNQPPIFRMSIGSAELAKVCLNAYVTVKISFANTIANLCERMPDADVDQITQAIGRDRRISPHYFKGGLSFGGTCFPRDTAAFAALAHGHALPAHLMDAVRLVNSDQDVHLADLVRAACAPESHRNIAVLGLAFTTNTSVVVESPAMKLIASLLADGHTLHVYDPLAMAEARATLGDAVAYAASPEECLAAAEVAVLCSPDPALTAAIQTVRPGKLSAIVDCWRAVDPAALPPDLTYRAMGRPWRSEVLQTAGQMATGSSLEPMATDSVRPRAASADSVLRT
jgi:UDPglucose 6-dehydrogenase